MTWERKEHVNPEELRKCHECGEWVIFWEYDEYFDMCKGCRDFYELEEERDLERWQEHGGKCALCWKSFNSASIVRFRQGWAHFWCAERFHETLELEHDLQKERGEP